MYSRLGAKAQPSSEQACCVISNHLHCVDSMSPPYAIFSRAPIIALYSHHRVHCARANEHVVTRSLAKAVWLRESKILDRGQTHDECGSCLLRAQSTGLVLCLHHLILAPSMCPKLPPV